MINLRHFSFVWISGLRRNFFGKMVKVNQGLGYKGIAGKSVRGEPSDADGSKIFLKKSMENCPLKTNILNFAIFQFLRNFLISCEIFEFFLQNLTLNIGKLQEYIYKGLELKQEASKLFISMKNRNVREIFIIYKRIF